MGQVESVTVEVEPPPPVVLLPLLPPPPVSLLVSPPVELAPAVPLLLLMLVQLKPASMARSEMSSVGVLGLLPPGNASYTFQHCVCDTVWRMPTCVQS